MTAHDSTDGARDTELHDLEDLLAQVFADSSPVPFDRELWSTLADLGLTRLTGAPARGGSGAGWAEAARLLVAAGASAAAVPVAENDLLAGWLSEVAELSEVGADVAGIRTVAVLDDTGRARHVPWARVVDSVVTLWKSPHGWRVAEMPVGRFASEPGENAAGEPRDTLLLREAADGGEPDGGVAVPDRVTAELELRGALARSLLMVGAMERTLELVVEHTCVRTQFGRPLGKFQAVQHLVADIAAETALTRAAAEAAVDVLASVGGPLSDTADLDRARFAVAAAKSCAGHAAAVVVRNAHQCLGAIGFTAEHELHRHTARLLAWRAEFGSTRRWDEVLLDSAVAAGSAGLWPLVTDSA